MHGTTVKITLIHVI